MKQSPAFLTENLPGFSIGGKAQNLFVLQQIGIQPPPFVVIPWEYLESADPDKLQQLSEEILTHFGRNRSTASFAVRSSAVSEDGAQLSYAGQFETLLNVPAENLAQAIAEVRGSANNERAATYRKEHGQPTELAIGVIVQTMLQPSVSGVAFGANPVNGKRSEKVVSAVYGLGEGLVSGQLDADTYILGANGAISRQIVQKDNMVVKDPASRSGNIMASVPKSQRSAPCLSDTQILEIAGVLDVLNAHFQCPQDIEFAIQDGQLHLLQTRPITALPPQNDTAEGRKTLYIWDNSNIVESYPGLTSPLTFTFILKMYEGAYRQMMQIMGVSQEDVEANKNVLANMLGLIEGRVYYNLRHWYMALAVLPGYHLNAAFMERMMGVKERFDLGELPKRSRLAERLRVLKMLKSMLSNLLGLPKMREDFEKTFESVVSEYQTIDFSRQSAEELAELYHRFEQTLLKEWKAPLVNDFFAMIYFGLLQKLTAKYIADESGTLHNNLLAGSKDVVSTEPIRLCMEIARRIRDDRTQSELANDGTVTSLQDLFLKKSPEELATLYQANQLPNGVSEHISHYLTNWGNRCVGELKLETITYAQHPALFFQIIQSYLRQNIQESHSHLELELRSDAESQAWAALKGRPLRRMIFRHVLRNARSLVSNRENLRYARTRGYGVVRQLFCALGERLHEAGLLDSPRDIFFLTQHEIFDHIKGTSVNGSLAQLAAMRKGQYAVWEKSPPPAERFATEGIVYAHNDFRLERNPRPEGADLGKLQGLGCCPGKVTAKARVVRNPAECSDLNGDILVTTNTDPGWVTLFPSASAIVVEKGSLLSHSAIVSRELGKPCVVGVSGLLAQVASGDLIEIDGSKGTVNILEKHEPLTDC